ncbi:HIPL1 protein-like [Curcuma longa]|uniref:HIPL1 protein-like n=1 Tax=Curcuma longa TaxID=136217 RepID=UPI003D9E6A0F
MEVVFIWPSLPLFLLFFLPRLHALQLCTNSMAPVALKTPLPFCGYTGSSCCNATEDREPRRQFEALNVSDTACAGVMRSIVCAICDPYSAELFDMGAQLGTIPNLCNSTVSAISSLARVSNQSFCRQVWDSCNNVTIQNSPFSRLPMSSSRLNDIWHSEADFCETFGGPSGDNTLCFDGNSASFNRSTASPNPKGLCLERIGNGSYLNMVAHPDGSNRVFVSNQAGKIWLATIPEQGSGGTLEIDESNPFLDLTDVVHYDTQFGLMGLAFHPNFTTNGRFFVSYNCDKLQSTSCSGRCSCNSDAGCDPSSLGNDNGAQPCQYQVVVAEYTANGSSAAPSIATSANPQEVRRIFTMGLPFTTHHGGQILFGPADGYLYFMMGDGGNRGDPFNFAQNKKALLGKIMRLDINNIQSVSQINDLGLWGNYSIPNDNPYTVDRELEAEIWAFGLRNPWRCSFDLERPSYFFCADVGQEVYEEVDLITKGGNYGWHVYEGPNLYIPQGSPSVNMSLSSINPIFPIMGYTHSDISTTMGSASITGGYVYRSTIDPCLYGRYLYADLYGRDIWAGTEIPENSGNYTSTLIPFSCAKNSPIPCDAVAGSPLPNLGYVYSFGEDNRKDVFLLSSSGVYRIISPSHCNYSCPLENTTGTGSSAPGQSSSACPTDVLLGRVVMMLFSLLWWMF